MTIVWNSQCVSVGLAEIEIARPLLLARVKQLLDDYHHQERTLRYYDILLGDWCERFLHLIYVATKDELNQVGLQEIKISKDTVDFFEDYPRLPDVASRALGALLELGPAGIVVQNAEMQITNRSSASRRNRILSKLVKLLRNQKSHRVLLVRPLLGRAPLSWVVAMVSWRRWATHDDLNIAYSTVVEPDTLWRQDNIFPIENSSSLSEICNSLAPVFIPASLVEGFADIREQIIARSPNRPQTIYSSQSLWGHLEFGILAALWSEQGTKIHYHQHGGWYGLDHQHVLESRENRIADVYYTWGWHRNSGNTKWLTPVIFKPTRQRKQYDSLICFDQPQQIYRLQYFPLPGTLETMYDQTAEFVKLRSSSTGLRVRLFPGDYGAIQRQAIIAARPETCFESKRDIFSQYSLSRLIIHSYLGTSWLETLGNNLPTVCFYDQDAYRFRDDAKELIDKLVAVGILHRSGKSAADHVNQIDQDIDGWWMSIQVQSARKEFTEQFARFSSNWKQEWESTLG